VVDGVGVEGVVKSRSWMCQKDASLQFVGVPGKLLL